MRKKRLATLTAAALASVLTGLSAGCASAAQTETRVIVPEILFPEFPAPPNSVLLDEESETVTMPLEYFARIYEYKVRVDEARAVYEGVTKLYESERGR